MTKKKQKIFGINKEELKKACEMVERAMRSIGNDCEIITMDEGVQIACLSWSGCIVEDNLYDAIITAKKEIDEDME